MAFCYDNCLQLRDQKRRPASCLKEFLEERPKVTLFQGNKKVELAVFKA